MLGKIMRIFIQSSDEFLVKEKELITSDVSERALCGAFVPTIMKYLEGTEFENYYTDIEYNRNFDRRVKTIIDDQNKVVPITCDLIVHSRGENPEQDNLIAIEMKKAKHPKKEKDKDRIRLKALTQPNNNSQIVTSKGKILPLHVCGYKLGVFYELCDKRSEIKIEYYVGGSLYKTYQRGF